MVELCEEPARGVLARKEGFVEVTICHTDASKEAGPQSEQPCHAQSERSARFASFPDLAVIPVTFLNTYTTHFGNPFHGTDDLSGSVAGRGFSFGCSDGTLRFDRCDSVKGVDRTEATS